MPEPLSFGVLCNSLMLERWQADSIGHLRHHGIELKLIVVRASGMEPAPSPIRSKMRKLLSGNAFFYFYNRYFFHPESKEIKDYSHETRDIPKLFCNVSKRGYYSHFHEKDLQTIRETGLDFILRFGFGIIGGEILTITRFGIWSFHHGDEQKYRGGPPGFWEIVYGDPVTGVMLQQLNERLDNGVILRKGWFKTKSHSYKEQLDQAYLQTTRWPLQVCITIQNGTFRESVSDSQAPLYRIPDNRTFIKFLFKLICNRLSFHWNELIRAEDWNIGIIHRAIHDVVRNGWNPKEVQWFPKPDRSKFIADPFLLEIEGINHVVFEYYNYRKSKGELFGIEIRTALGFPQNIKRILQAENHVSFPFIFSFQGEHFLIPESHQDNRIALYRWYKENGQFEYQNTLVDDVRGVDASIIHHQGMWWLFFTKKDLPSVHLYLYYSRTLFDAFNPHPNNPVKTDIRSSRPAGRLFQIDNRLIRPAQDCSDHYGKRVVLNHILKLSVHEFEEEEYRTISPHGNYYNRGLHTINGNEQVTLIDGKEIRFLWSNLFQGIKRKTMKRKGEQEI